MIAMQQAPLERLIIADCQSYASFCLARGEQLFMPGQYPPWSTTGTQVEKGIGRRLRRTGAHVNVPYELDKLVELHHLAFRTSAMATPHSKSTRSAGPAPKRAAAPKAMPAATTGAKTLVKIYGWARTKSDRSGRAVRIIVDFEPNRRPKFTKVVAEAASKPATSSAPMHDPNLEDALARARKRGRSRVAEILGGDDMLSADAFASLLGTTRVTVNAKRQKRQVLGLEGAKHGKSGRMASRLARFPTCSRSSETMAGRSIDSSSSIIPSWTD
jgi:hypothetical protein